MKTLIIGEVVDNKLSTGALEIVTKANDLGLDYEIVTVGLNITCQISTDIFLFLLIFSANLSAPDEKPCFPCSA